ncbi:MAG: PEP-utilizing enzyme, partial [Pseudoflavonifractor sp.]
MNRITGLAGAKGQVLLPAMVLTKQTVTAQQRTVADPEAEVARFKTFQQAYIDDLSALYEKTLSEVGAAAADIINTYRVIAQDAFFFEKPLKRVMAENINVDFAVAEACDKVCRKFAAMQDPYLQERAHDIRNVCDELIRRINGVTAPADSGGEELSILVAEDLTPEDTVRIDKSRLGGFITARGGVTSHAVILAKTLGIPAVVGAAGILEAVRAGDQVYLNGDEGWAVIAPDAATTERFTAARAQQEKRRVLYERSAGQPAVTLDGHRVAVCVNSGDSDSINTFCAEHCDGVGLFRTEFLFMGQTDYPDEE